jgi:hypothetical protein
VARDGGERPPAAVAVATGASETGGSGQAGTPTAASGIAPGSVTTITFTSTVEPATTVDPGAPTTGAATTSEIVPGTTDPPLVEPPATTGQPETTEPPATTQPPTTVAPTTTQPPSLPPDTKAPNVSLGSGPADPTSETSARFSFSASEQSSFRCALDGAAFASCKSPKTYAGLALGQHTFSVYAIDKAGNQSATKSYSWRIEAPPDTQPPNVSISGTPASRTSSTSATFRFEASEPATFECNLDNAGFVPCSSPVQYSGLAPGRHTWSVRATDNAGNTGGAAGVAWVIEEPGRPDLVITAITRGIVVVANVGNASAGAFVVRVTPGGSFTVSGLAAGASVTLSVTCRVGTVVAVADAGAQVAESNEGNNTLTTVVTSC